MKHYLNILLKMNLLKKLLIGLLGMVSALVIISLFLPSKFHIERSQSIGVPREVLFDQVNTLKNWEKWSPWHNLDPSMKLAYTGPSSGVGASYNWQSQDANVGNGKVTVKSMALGDSITVEMDFMEQGLAAATYKFIPTDNGTNLIWKFDQDLGENPVNKIFGALFLENMLGKDFEKGLSNIDSLAKATLPTKIVPLPMSVVRSR